MKTYELQRTKIKVNRATWRQTLVESMQKDKTLSEAHRTNRRLALGNYELRQERDKATHTGWCQALDSVRGSLRGYPEHGGDIEIMTEVEKIAAAARLAGQEEVLTLLESYGYSEPPKLSGRGMAALLRKRLAIIAQAKKAAKEFGGLKGDQPIVDDAVGGLRKYAASLDDLPVPPGYVGRLDASCASAARLAEIRRTGIYPEKHTITVTPPCTAQRCYRPTGHSFICPAQQAGISQERK